MAERYGKWPGVVAIVGDAEMYGGGDVALRSVAMIACALILDKLSIGGSMGCFLMSRQGRWSDG